MFNRSNEKSLKLMMGYSYLPKENGMTPEGDDSHFICEEDDVFGVADGVGSWAKKGIDAGKYARELMTNCVIAVQNEPKGFIHPLSILEEAYSNTKSEGSSTACIVALTTDNCLHFANVGDSSFVVIRGDSVIYGSPTQQRRFNCPFQLGNHAHNDEPSSAYEFKVPVEEGDVVVAGTDGLFDNLFTEDIVDMVFPTTYIGKFPYWLAELIVKVAKMASQDKLYTSPFSLGAEMFGYSHSGGKPDDITALVAYVVIDRKQIRNVSDPKFDLCDVEGVVRIHGKSSKIFAVLSQMGDLMITFIKEFSVNATVSNEEAPPCSLNHCVPAVIFSTGRYAAINHWFLLGEDLNVRLLTVLVILHWIWG
ncbi:hypothetical protein NE237_005989 [Protea cynaroides]|uniref:Protein phosphatase n=1 Tax=Protea cynaroides TaxID=273540 RepID=A0A9Q0KLT9_9MAGN|nr:hypothetical protein NE237_005989 [Protea cynaroides]